MPLWMNGLSLSTPKGKNMRAALIILALIFLAHGALAAEDVQPKFTKNELYKHFRYTLSPKEAFDFVQQAAVWLSEQGEAGLDEFGKPFSKWNHMDGTKIQLGVWNAEKGMILRHCNPKLQHLVGIPNLTHKVKDHSGRLGGLVLRNKLLKNPKGAWTTWYSTFILSATGVEEPMYLLNFGVGVPGYPWQVTAYFPYEVDSLEELQEVVDDLDALVEQWSTIEFE